MKELRQEVLKQELQVAYKDQQTLYAITGIFERMFWLMRRITDVIVNRNQAQMADKD